jgi:hypothetical protein
MRMSWVTIDRSCQRFAVDPMKGRDLAGGRGRWTRSAGRPIPTPPPRGRTGCYASCATSCDGGWTRSGKPDVQDEVPEPQVEYSAAGPVHDERQQDDGQDYDDHPEEEHDDHELDDGDPFHRAGPGQGNAAVLAGQGQGERQTEADGSGARGQVSTSDFPEASHDWS